MVLREAGNKYKAFVRNFPDALCYHRISNETGNQADYMFVDVNRSFEELFGIRKDNILGNKIGDVMPIVSAFDFDWPGIYREAAESGKEVKFEYYCEPLGRWYKISAYSDGEGGFFTVFRDVTEYKEKEEMLEKQFALEKLFSDISSYFVSLPARELSEGINHALKMVGEFFGVDCACIFRFSGDGKTMTITNQWSRKEAEPVSKALNNLPLDRVPWWTVKNRQKESLCIHDTSRLSGKAEAEKDLFEEIGLKTVISMPVIQDGVVSGAFILGSVGRLESWRAEHERCLISLGELLSCAITRNLAFSEIYYKSYHDHLTGLYNRSYLEKEIERINGESLLPVTIIKADINSLKLVNDAYGHKVGDKLLMKVTEILRKTCRDEDIIARWGGDEFVVILPQTTKEAARVLYERIKNSCMEAFMKDVPVSIAIGLSCKDTPEKDLHKTLEEAESDMYRQKLAESRTTRSTILNSLLTTLGAKSYETEMHFRQMRNLACNIGKKIKLPGSELTRLKLLATLHDIGKINIPEEVLTKKEPLNVNE